MHNEKQVRANRRRRFLRYYEILKTRETIGSTSIRMLVREAHSDCRTVKGALGYSLEHVIEELKSLGGTLKNDR